MIGYHAQRRLDAARTVQGWANVAMWKPTVMAQFFRQAANPRAPNVSNKAHVFARRVLRIILKET